jgi:hypothetical protein
MTLVLLLSAATAHAECSWVLWVQVSEGEGEETKKLWPWEIIQAIGGRQECDQIVQAKVNQPSNVLKKRVPNVAGVKTDKGTDLYHYLCLPDTIDPRWPKAE